VEGGSVEGGRERVWREECGGSECGGRKASSPSRAILHTSSELFSLLHFTASLDLQTQIVNKINDPQSLKVVTTIYR